jgi:replicative DNA helicase
MIIKRAIAVESLTKVCEESLNLIKQLIDADNEVYAKGYEDGMAAESEVQKTLRPWIGLTDEEIVQMGLSNYMKVVRETEAKLKEKNAKT